MCTCKYTQAHISVHIYRHMYTHIHENTHVHTQTCTHMHTYIHIYIHNGGLDSPLMMTYKNYFKLGLEIQLSGYEHLLFL